MCNCKCKKPGVFATVDAACPTCDYSFYDKAIYMIDNSGRPTNKIWCKRCKVYVVFGNYWS